MEGHKNRKRALSPHGTFEENRELEQREGTRVPNLEMFAPDTTAQAAEMDKLKGIWTCEEHGTCFITSESVHILLNRFRLKAWATAVLAGRCIISEPPPSELLREWLGNNKASAPSTATAHPVAPAASTSNSDAAALMMATMVPVMTMMAHNLTESMSKKSKASRLSPPSSPVRQSSPLPAISDELEHFLDAFSRAKEIPEDRLTIAREQLHEARSC